MLVERDKKIYPPIFEDFWIFYPRKVRKKATYLIWKRLLIRQRIEVRIASKNYANAMDGKEEEFILLPTTFLSPKKCLWEDYMKPAKKNKSWLQQKMEEQDE